MVTKRRMRNRRERAYLMVDLMVAIGLIAAVLLPVSYSFVHEKQLMRAAYYRTVAMEIVDGEMEVLLAGEWKSHPDGDTVYPVAPAKAALLPKGEFRLQKTADRIRLEWNPEGQRKIVTPGAKAIRAIMREAALK